MSDAPIDWSTYPDPDIKERYRAEGSVDKINEMFSWSYSSCSGKYKLWIDADESHAFTFVRGEPTVVGGINFYDATDACLFAIRFPEARKL